MCIRDRCSSLCSGACRRRFFARRLIFRTNFRLAWRVWQETGAQVLGQTEQVAGFSLRNQQSLYGEPLDKLVGVRTGKASERLHVGNVNLALAGQVSEDIGFLPGEAHTQACLCQKLGFGNELFLA